MEFKAYEICGECKTCVILNEAGFDVEMHICSLCGRHVADKDDFLTVDAVEIMSK